MRAIRNTARLRPAKHRASRRPPLRPIDVPRLISTPLVIHRFDPSLSLPITKTWISIISLVASHRKELSRLSFLPYLFFFYAWIFEKKKKKRKIERVGGGRHTRRIARIDGRRRTNTRIISSIGKPWRRHRRVDRNARSEFFFSLFLIIIIIIIFVFFSTEASKRNACPRAIS